MRKSIYEPLLTGLVTNIYVNLKKSMYSYVALILKAKPGLRDTQATKTRMNIQLAIIFEN